jgi:hypothetical protein
MKTWQYPEIFEIYIFINGLMYLVALFDNADILSMFCSRNVAPSELSISSVHRPGIHIPGYTLSSLGLGAMVNQRFFGIKRQSKSTFLDDEKGLFYSVGKDISQRHKSSETQRSGG